jgi:hypothetical protein
MLALTFVRPASAPSRKKPALPLEGNPFRAGAGFRSSGAMPAPYVGGQVQVQAQLSLISGWFIDFPESIPGDLACQANWVQARFSMPPAAL